MSNNGIVLLHPREPGVQVFASPKYWSTIAVLHRIEEGEESESIFFFRF